MFFNEWTLKELARHARLSVQVSLDGDEAMHDAFAVLTIPCCANPTKTRVEHGIRCSVLTTVVDVDFMARADAFIAFVEYARQYSRYQASDICGQGGERGVNVDGKKWNEHVYRVMSAADEDASENEFDGTT